MKTLSTIVVALLLFASSCKQKSHNKEQSSTSVSEINYAILANSFYKQMVGKMGENDITLHLTKIDSFLFGNYFFHNTGIPISIFGTIDKSGKFNLSELNYEDGNGAKFEGVLSEKNGMKGYWKNGKSKNKFELTVLKNPQFDLKLAHLEEKKCLSDEKKLAIIKTSDFSSTDTMCSSVLLNYFQIESKKFSFAKRINTAILKSITNSNQEKSTLAGYLKNYHQYFEKEEFSFYESELSMALISNDSEILSFESTSYIFTGGAHGSTAISFLNFNAKSGDLIDPNDILVNDFQKKFAPIAEKKFHKEYGTKGWFFTKGEFPINTNFGITPKGLLFTFNQYELGPYVAGNQSLFFTFKELVPFLRKNKLVNQIIR